MSFVLCFLQPRRVSRGQNPCRFNNGAFTVNPLWLDVVQPRTLDRQPAGYNPHSSLLRICLVLSEKERKNKCGATNGLLHQCALLLYMEEMDLGLAVQIVAVRGNRLMLNHSIAPDDTGTLS